MSKKLKYAVVSDEFIETPFFDTDTEAIKHFHDNLDDEETFADRSWWSVQGYTDEQIAELEAQPDV